MPSFPSRRPDDMAGRTRADSIHKHVRKVAPKHVRPGFGSGVPTKSGARHKQHAESSQQRGMATHDFRGGTRTVQCQYPGCGRGRGAAVHKGRYVG